MIIPLHQSCVLMRAEPMEKKIGVGGDAGSQRLFEMPGTDGNLGKLAAYNTRTMKAAWSFQQKSPFLTGVLTTDGGMGFVGDWRPPACASFETATGKTFVADAPADRRPRTHHQLCGGRQAIYRGGKGWASGSHKGKPATLLPGHSPSEQRQWALRILALPDN